MAQKILVIDDDRINVKIIQSRLENEGYEATTALDGTEGLEMVKKSLPDLIILDIQMPKMNGYTFMIELKKIPSGVSIPVIVLTAYDDMEPIFRLKGVREYLVKPINFDELFEKIKKCLPVQEGSSGDQFH